MYFIDTGHLKGQNPVRYNTLVFHFSLAGILKNCVNRIITCTVCTPAAMVVTQMERLPWNFPRWNKLEEAHSFLPITAPSIPLSESFSPCVEDKACPC
jgi:hypothetical protein